MQVYLSPFHYPPPCGDRTNCRNKPHRVRALRIDIRYTPCDLFLSIWLVGCPRTPVLSFHWLHVCSSAGWDGDTTNRSSRITALPFHPSDCDCVFVFIPHPFLTVSCLTFEHRKRVHRLPRNVRNAPAHVAPAWFGEEMSIAGRLQGRTNVTCFSLCHRYWTVPGVCVLSCCRAFFLWVASPLRFLSTRCLTLSFSASVFFHLI